MLKAMNINKILYGVDIHRRVMYSMLYEAFDSPSAIGQSQTTTTYTDPRVKAICQDTTLDGARQLFISTLQDIVAKLTAIDATSAGINERLSGYKIQLIRINDLNDALIQIVGVFNGDSKGSSANMMQNLNDISIALQKNTTLDPQYLTSTQTIVTQAEDIIRSLYSLANKLETMRNHLINFVNINNRNVSYSRLLCLKNEFLNSALQTLATTLNTNLQTFETNLSSWCSQIAAVQINNSGNCQQPVPTPTPTPNIPGSDICSNFAGTPANSAMRCSDDDTCYLTTMSTYNPKALPNQYKDLKNCVTTALASSSDSQARYAAAQNCTNTWLAGSNCVPYKGYTGVGPVASNQPVSPVLTPGSVTSCSITANNFTGACATLFNNCIAAGGSSDACNKLAQNCSTAPDNYCPPQPPACGPGIGNCPNSKMTWNAAKGEYDITSHPDISQWGVQNTVWGGGSQFVPDYVAQKMQVDNRCEPLDSFDITKHKDIVKYVAKDRYSSMKSRANTLQSRLTTCENAFQGSSCQPVNYSAANPNPSTASQTSQTVETFADAGSDANQTSTSVGTNIGTDTNTDPDTCGFVDDAGMTFDITTHKQFPTIIQNYTPNNQLSQVCPRVLDCASYPIENNKDIGKYVLRSTIPSTPAGCFTNLQDSPDFASYQSTWQAKADLAAKTAKDAADASCADKIAQYSAKDPCGNPTTCKGIADYNLEDHPKFAAYSQAWQDKLSSLACQDASGNLIKCPYSQNQTIDDIPAVAQLKADVAACQANLTNSVPKDKCLTSADFDTYDITRHPDIKKYVLRTSVPDLNALQKCRKKIGDLKQTSHQKLLDQKNTLEKTLNQYACKDDQGNFTACQKPNMSNYILKSDVKPCPAGLSDTDISKLVQKNVNKYLDSSSMSQMCRTAGFSKGNSSKPGHVDDGCAKHFVAANAAGLEGFTSQCSPVDKYPEHSAPSDKWDVMLHKDYKYSDKKAGHIPKKECYNTYAFIDKSGNPLNYAQAFKQSSIQDHPQYEATLMKYGAIKDKCGKLVPAPPCPCLVRDQCGNLVPENKIAKPNKDCTIENKCDAALMKEKLKFNILLSRYKDLLKSVGGDKQDSAKFKNQLGVLQNQLQSLQSSITKSSTTPASAVHTASCPKRYTPRNFDDNARISAINTDMVDPMAAARPGIHGWNYS